MVSRCKLPGVRSFVLEVGSWSDNSIPVNLYQMNAILCSDKKRQGLEAQLSPSKVQVLAKGRWSLLAPVTLPGSLHRAPSLGPPTSAQAGLRRQISAGAALGARSPDPVQLSSRREPGTQDPAGPQALQTAGGEVPRTAHQANCCCPSVPVWGLGSASLGPLSLGPASGGAGEGSGAQQDRAPSLTPPPSTGPRPGEQEGSGGEGRDLPLTSLAA